MQALEHHERTEMAHHHGHGGEHGGHGEPSSGEHAKTDTKKVAILIMVLAALLAIGEMGAKSSQNAYLANHIEASNLWSFYQAKTIRQTIMRTVAEEMEVQPKHAPDIQSGIQKKIEKFYANADRYESEPATGEGRKELMARAKTAEAKRDRALSAYHMFEYGAAALQLAIVLASAAVITGLIMLAYAGGALGLIGVAFAALGFFAPTLIHL